MTCRRRPKGFRGSRPFARQQTQLLREALIEAGWTETEGVDYDLFWDPAPATRAKVAAVRNGQRYSHFRGSGNLADADRLFDHLVIAQLQRGDAGYDFFPQTFTLTDPDPHVRMCARDFAGAIVDFAGGFGVPAIIGSMQGRVADGVDRDQALAWLREELDQLGPRAHALDAPLLYEPLNRYETNLFNTVADSLDFLATLRTRNVKLLVDLFHANIEERDPAAAIRRAGPAVGHIHFADSNRHAIGLGHTDVAPVIQALKDIGYDGYISAEIHPNRPNPPLPTRPTNTPGFNRQRCHSQVTASRPPPYAAQKTTLKRSPTSHATRRASARPSSLNRSSASPDSHSELGGSSMFSTESNTAAHAFRSSTSSELSERSTGSMLSESFPVVHKGQQK